MRKTVHAICEKQTHFATKVKPTVPISEIPRLLQAYVDEGSGLSCFLVMQIVQHYLS